MGFIIALLVVIAVLVVSCAVVYLIDKDADVSDRA